VYFIYSQQRLIVLWCCRQAFPCWDEPAIKATFDMRITAPADRIVLSNMPELSSEPCAADASLKTVTFQTTPIMSTYLVAIVVGKQALLGFVKNFDLD
jgi:aminopeptidase N